MGRVFLFSGLLLAACQAPSNQTETKPLTSTVLDQRATAEDAPSLEIDLHAKDLIFRFFEEGKIKVVTKLDEVPMDQRHAVYIDDLSVSPEIRKSNRYLQRYDLTQGTNERGKYQGTPVLRTAIESQIQKSRPKTVISDDQAIAQLDPTKLKESTVFLYSTASCGYCKKARKFLTKKGIPFKEKDIEKSPAARKELQSKAQRAGIQVNGVPVLDVNGEIITGYNPEAILKALGG